MNSDQGYWKRQLYMLSSLGLFYIILIALFAIPLVGTFVVILIKGALDLRYFIIAFGCLGFTVLGAIIVRGLRKLWLRFRSDGSAAGKAVLCQEFMGQPMEVSIFGGLLKFTVGNPHANESLAPPHRKPLLLSERADRDAVTDIVYQLQGLTELKRAGAIDSEEFNLLKTVLIEASASLDANPEPIVSSGHEK
jgi:hypothetical protein